MDLPINIDDKNKQIFGIFIIVLSYIRGFLAKKRGRFQRILMALHESKDNSIFDILAVGFALTLILLYVSGVIITLFIASKKKRKSQYITIVAGIVVCASFASVAVFL